jgi:hypothetical protein
LVPDGAGKVRTSDGNYFKASADQDQLEAHSPTDYPCIGALAFEVTVHDACPQDGVPGSSCALNQNPIITVFLPLRLTAKRPACFLPQGQAFSYLMQIFSTPPK